ncbi:BLOC-1-related complex subunit 6 isoform X2 [Arapaima gigas]
MLFMSLFFLYKYVYRLTTVVELITKRCDQGHVWDRRTVLGHEGGITAFHSVQATLNFVALIQLNVDKGHAYCVFTAAERMSHSPGIGSAEHAVSNGLDSPGSLSSSDEEQPGGFRPPKCTERVLGPTEVSPTEKGGSPSRGEECEDPAAAATTCATDRCCADPRQESGPHAVHPAAAGKLSTSPLEEVQREGGGEAGQVDRQEEMAGTHECSADTKLVPPPAVSGRLPSEEKAGSPSPLQGHEAPHPPHVMAQVQVRTAPERERLVRGMQDSKSLDEISQACGGARGPPEGRRATISSALELEGTVSHDGDVTHFITRNLEHKIKMSSRPSLDSDSHGWAQNRGLFDRAGQNRAAHRQPADIPPIDPGVLLDLQKQAQDVAQSVDLVMRGLGRTIQNMTALSVGYIQTYRDSVDSVGESVDMSIKGMYTLMARCEELDRSMQPIHSLAKQIRDIKQTLDVLETLCK